MNLSLSMANYMCETSLLKYSNKKERCVKFEKQKYSLPSCHLLNKNYRFPDNLPGCQALSAKELSHIIWRGILGSSVFVFSLSSPSEAPFHAPR